jgi:hypothetical protein
MRSAVSRLIAIALCALAACSDAPTLDDACRNVCDCEQPLPAANRQCVAACADDLGGRPIVDACLDCLVSLTCEQLETGDPCFACQDPDDPFDLSARTALSP